jgi:hypothetical protein
MRIRLVNVAQQKLFFHRYIRVKNKFPALGQGYKLLGAKLIAWGFPALIVHVTAPEEQSSPVAANEPVPSQSSIRSNSSTRSKRFEPNS